MKVVQVTLHSDSSVRTCWVEAGIKRGQQITLKDSEDPGRWWEVVSVDSDPVEKSSINRGWNNNI